MNNDGDTDEQRPETVLGMLRKFLARTEAEKKDSAWLPALALFPTDNCQLAIGSYHCYFVQTYYLLRFS